MRVARQGKAPLRVAIQGEAGAFSHQAAEQLYGPGLELVSTRTFEDLFTALVDGSADRIVVPVENTLAGSVPGNLDRILERGLQVLAETLVRIRLHLVVPPGRALGEVHSAASHPVALQQCQNFFRSHPSIEPVAVYDTAGSVRDLMSGAATYDGAIGSPLAAELYGASSLLPEIEDDSGNFTRFFAVGPANTETNADVSKTSLAFVVAHEPGSLYRALGVFAQHGIDLMRLESRPMRGRPWEYRFYVDVRGDPSGPLGASIEDLKNIAAELRILGTYPEWPAVYSSG